MAMKKITIPLPEPVVERVDKLAASRGGCRSYPIATVLDRVARAKLSVALIWSSKQELYLARVKYDHPPCGYCGVTLLLRATLPG